MIPHTLVIYTVADKFGNKLLCHAIRHTMKGPPCPAIPTPLLTP